MSSSFRDERIADEHRGGQMQCRSCRGQYDPKMILEHGGLCFACFQHYCRDGSDNADLTLAARHLLIARLK